MSRRFFLLCCLLLLSAGSLLGREIHVSGTGRDTNDGSAGKPFREIRRAVRGLVPGDTVLIGDGQYLGFDLNRVGKAGKVTMLKATGSKAVILPTKDRRASNAFNILLIDCTQVVVDGLRTYNGPTAGMRLLRCNRAEVRNGVFGDNGKWGIVTSHCVDLVIENNECYGSRLEHGIYVSNSGDRPIVRGNRFHDNAGSGLRSNGDIGQGGDGIISGAVFENNIIYNNGAGANGGAAINLDGLQDGIIRNNVIYNNHGSGIALFKGCGAAGPKGMQVLYNTVIMAADARYCLRITDAIGPLVVRNNIFFNLNMIRGGISWDTDQDVACTDSDYNLFGGGMRVSPRLDAPKTMLEEWMAAGREPHSVVQSDLGFLFSDAGKNDFRLREGSAAIDRGLVVEGTSRDVEGHERSQGGAPDLGAYEFKERPSP